MEENAAGHDYRVYLYRRGRTGRGRTERVFCAGANLQEKVDADRAKF
jgi:hypothetical protein